MPDRWVLFRDGQPVTNGQGRLKVFTDWDEGKQRRTWNDTLQPQSPQSLARIAREYGVALPRMEGGVFDVR